VHPSHSKLRNLLGWEPELVRVTQTVKFTGGGFLLAGHVCSAVGVELDGLGLTVQSHDFPPRPVSLHPSEFEVLNWRPPSPGQPSATSPAASPVSHVERF
jgi:hypothetical protein